MTPPRINWRQAGLITLAAAAGLEVVFQVAIAGQDGERAQRGAAQVGAEPRRPVRLAGGNLPGAEREKQLVTNEAQPTFAGAGGHAGRK